MLLPDINILVYSHRNDVPDHDDYRTWLEDTLHGAEPVALCGPVLAGFVRIVTHPRVFTPPTPLEQALEFVAALRAGPAALTPSLTEHHLDAFLAACRGGRVRGAMISDAYLAGIAISLGCELVTADRGFARYPGLRWRHPFND